MEQCRARLEISCFNLSGSLDAASRLLGKHKVCGESWKERLSDLRFVVVVLFKLELCLVLLFSLR